MSYIDLIKDRARSDKKTIVLPESTDKRTLIAAAKIMEEGIANIILESLKAQGGFIAVHDKSDPDLIYSLFRCSKKAFKQAIGSLYKQKLITIEPQGIKLV